jgi:hypothetical protein
MTLSIATLCTECHYAECGVSLIVMQNVAMLNVVTPFLQPGQAVRATAQPILCCLCI